MATTPRYKLGPSSLGEALFEALRDRIVQGEIEPGERLTELRVAEEYGVARPTAKACLERLTGLGLLRRSARKSAVVPVFTAAEIEDLYFSRSKFESMAAGHLAGIRHVPQEMLTAQQAMREADEHGKFTELVDADIAFHWGLVNGFDSERLRRMYRMISGEIQLTIGRYQAHRRTTITTVVNEHQAVIDAIADGDATRAIDALAKHIALARDRVLAELAEQQAEQSAPDPHE